MSETKKKIQQGLSTSGLKYTLRSLHSKFQNCTVVCGLVVGLYSGGVENESFYASLADIINGNTMQGPYTLVLRTLHLGVGSLVPWCRVLGNAKGTLRIGGCQETPRSS